MKTRCTRNVIDIQLQRRRRACGHFGILVILSLLCEKDFPIDIGVFRHEYYVFLR